MVYEFPRGTGQHQWQLWPYGEPSQTYPYYDTQWWYTCPHCSKTIKAESVYCSHCGAKLITEETEADKLDTIISKLDELIEAVKEVSKWQMKLSK